MTTPTPACDLGTTATSTAHTPAWVQAVLAVTAALLLVSESLAATHRWAPNSVVQAATTAGAAALEALLPATPTTSTPLEPPIPTRTASVPSSPAPIELPVAAPPPPAISVDPVSRAE